MSKKPKKDYCIGHISGQATEFVYNSRGWRWKPNPYVNVALFSDNNVLQNFRIKTSELVKMIKKEDFRIIKKRVHRYLEIDRSENETIHL